MIFWVSDTKQKSTPKEEEKKSGAAKEKKGKFILFYFMILFLPKLAEFSIHKATLLPVCIECSKPKKKYKKKKKF